MDHLNHKGRAAPGHRNRGANPERRPLTSAPSWERPHAPECAAPSLNQIKISGWKCPCLVNPRRGLSCRLLLSDKPAAIQNACLRNRDSSAGDGSALCSMCLQIKPGSGLRHGWHFVPDTWVTPFALCGGRCQCRGRRLHPWRSACVLSPGCWKESRGGAAPSMRHMSHDRLQDLGMRYGRVEGRRTLNVFAWPQYSLRHWTASCRPRACSKKKLRFRPRADHLESRLYRRWRQFCYLCLSIHQSWMQKVAPQTRS